VTMPTVLDAALDEAATEARDHQENEERRPHRERVFKDLMLDIRERMLARGVTDVTFTAGNRRFTIRHTTEEGCEEMRLMHLASDLSIRRYAPGLVFNRHPEWEVIYSRSDFASYRIKEFNEALSHALRANVTEE